MIKTRIGTSDNVCDPLKESFEQHVELLCPFFQRPVKIPIYKNIYTDYESAYKEMEKSFADCAILNQKYYMKLCNIKSLWEQIISLKSGLREETWDIIRKNMNNLMKEEYE